MATEFNEEDVSENLNNLSINSDERRPFSDNQNKNRRRGINKHLYGKPNNNGNRGRSDNSHQQSRQHSENNGRGHGRGNMHNGRGMNNGEEHGRGTHHSSQNGYSNNSFEFKSNNGHYAPPQRSGHFNGNHPPKKKNTETFKPSHKPTDMRFSVAFGDIDKYSKEITSRDVIAVHGLFCKENDLTIYDKLLHETKECDIDFNNLWQLWHGDTHLIADDKTKWKDSCPTFLDVLKKIESYFDMNIQATRLNWYRDSKEWKPFHHDAAAINPEKAKIQNFTVAVSFGAERDAAFEHATTRTVISMPQPNGSVYTFGKDVNVIWRHGILQVPPDKYHNQGRISIIAWGSVKQTQL